MKDLGVLVVHDNEEALSVIKRMFSHFKIRVDCVGSTTEALCCLKTKNYRTLITDMDMPGMSGIELARRAQKLFPKLSVTMFSGHSTEQIMKLILNPKVLVISEEGLRPCAINEMLRDIMNKESGKVFLLE